MLDLIFFSPCRYVLRNKPEVWTEKLREQVLGAFDNLLDLLGLIQVEKECVYTFAHVCGYKYTALLKIMQASFEPTVHFPLN